MRRRPYLTTFLAVLAISVAAIFCMGADAPKSESALALQPAKACKLGDVECKVTSGTSALVTTAGTISMIMPTTPTAAGDMVIITLQGVPTASLPKLRYWVWPNDGTQVIAGQGLQFNDPAFMVFSAKSAGTYKFIVVAPDGAGDLLTATQVLVVNGPNPPGPNPPGPNPPGPNPPLPPGKFRFLMLYDPATLDVKQPGETDEALEARRQVIFAVNKDSVRGYVDAHTVIDDVKDAEGGVAQMPARRIWPVTVDPSQAGALWTPLLKAANGKTGMVVQVGTNIQRFDLPATNADGLKVLQPIGGN